MPFSEPLSLCVEIQTAEYLNNVKNIKNIQNLACQKIKSLTVQVLDSILADISDNILYNQFISSRFSPPSGRLGSFDRDRIYGSLYVQVSNMFVTARKIAQH